MHFYGGKDSQQSLSVSTRVIESEESVHQEVLDYASESDVDLVVMGTHGRTGLSRLILGSVTERMIRSAPIPVLTVHEETPINFDFEKILVPTDGSDTANAAADHAIQLAAMTGAAIHIVHVVNLTAVSDEYGSAAVLDALEKRGQRAVDNIIDRADEAGIQSIEASVLSGAPPRAIVDYAADRDIDLITMGTHGRSGLDRYFIGSVTEKVVRLAEMPVLSISPREST